MIYVPRYNLNAIYHALFQIGHCKSVKGVQPFIKTKNVYWFKRRKKHTTEYIIFLIMCVSLSWLCRNCLELSLLSVLRYDPHATWLLQGTRQSLLPQLQTRHYHSGVCIQQWWWLIHRFGLWCVWVLSWCKWLPGAGYGGFGNLLSLVGNS